MLTARSAGWQQCGVGVDDSGGIGDNGDSVGNTGGGRRRSDHGKKGKRKTGFSKLNK